MDNNFWFSMLLAASKQGGASPVVPPSGLVLGTPSSLLDRAIASSGGEVEVYRVNSLAASGNGTLKGACENRNTAANGVVRTRIVLFDARGVTTQPESGNADENNVRQPILVDDGNLFLAGQTAPTPDEGGTGTGAGVVSRSTLDVRVENIGNTVVSHLTFQASSGGAVQQGDGEPMQGQSQFQAHRKRVQRSHFSGRMALLNCCFKFGQDVCVVAQGLAKPEGGGYETNILRGVYYGDTIFSDTLNSSIFQQDGPYHDPSKTSDPTTSGGHAYGPNFRNGTEGALMSRCLIAGCTHRTPQFGTLIKLRMVNSLVDNFGGDPGGTSPWRFPAQWTNSKPFAFDDALAGSGNASVLNGRFEAMGNYAQAGPGTLDPWDTHPYFTMNYNGTPSFGNHRIYDGAHNGNPNRGVNFWSGTPSRTWDGERDSSLLQGTAVFDADLSPQPVGDDFSGKGQSATPVTAPFSADPLNLHPATDVRGFIQSYAGPFPAHRQAYVTRLISEVMAYSHYGVGAPVADTEPTDYVRPTPIQVGDDGGAEWTVDPLAASSHIEVFTDADTHNAFRRRSNGMREIEHWLWRRHVAMGGAPTWEMQEWLNRDFGGTTL